MWEEVVVVVVMGVVLWGCHPSIISRVMAKGGGLRLKRYDLDFFSLPTDHAELECLFSYQDD